MGGNGNKKRHPRHSPTVVGHEQIEKKKTEILGNHVFIFRRVRYYQVSGNDSDNKCMKIDYKRKNAAVAWQFNLRVSRGIQCREAFFAVLILIKT